MTLIKIISVYLLIFSATADDLDMIFPKEDNPQADSGYQTANQLLNPSTYTNTKYSFGSGNLMSGKSATMQHSNPSVYSYEAPFVQKPTYQTYQSSVTGGVKGGTGGVKGGTGGVKSSSSSYSYSSSSSSSSGSGGTGGVKTKTPLYNQSGVKTYQSGTPAKYEIDSLLKPHETEILCPGKPNAPNNANLKCTQTTCRADCINDYKFPNGAKTLYISCSDGEWTIQDSEWPQIPDCKPTCLPECMNNGFCAKPNVCNCPDDYTGAYCQNKKTFCVKNTDPLPKNSRRACSSTSCTIACNKGHVFPDKTNVLKVICKEGQWIPEREGMSVVPDCEPTCTPQCQNGGNCLSLNVCQCPPEFRGPQCQYSESVCSPKKMAFNGGYSCSGDDTSFSCSLKCPQGIQFSAPPAPKYTCQYSTGIFLPKVIPQCMGGDMELISSGSHSKTTYRKSNHSSSSFGYSGGYKSSGIKSGSMSSGSEYEDGSEEYEIITRKIIKRRRRIRTSLSIPQFDFDDNTDFSQVQFPGIYSHYLEKDVDVLNKQPKSAMCTTWNGNKVKTLDGLTYRSPLYCSHTLLQDRIDGSLSIILKACPFGSVQPCPHALDIFLQARKYSFVNVDGQVKLYSIEKQLPIPAQLEGLRVTMVGNNLKVLIEPMQVTVFWNKQQTVSIQTTPSMWNRTVGLCGTLDNNIDNDFTAKTGNIMKMPSTFVDSWRASDLDNDPKCTMDRKEDMQAKTCEAAIKLKAATICKKLLDNVVFSNCTDNLDVDSLLVSCMSDYCYCANKINPEKCVCSGISVLAKDCQFQGVTMKQGWRNLEICPLPCKDGRIYKACGPSFEPSCGSAVESSTNVCHEGCFCPDGTIQWNGKCVQPNECPCVLREKIFKPNSQITRDCNKCTCEKGVWKCTDLNCGSRCGVLGDPHYRTFDGKSYDFMGKCSYYLLKTDNFTVEAENVACPGSISEAMGITASAASDMPSCTKSVTINYNDGGQHSIKLKQGKVILVDGIELTQFPKKLMKGLIKIRQPSSIMTSVEFQDGIKIWWDGMTRVYIDAPATYRGRTKGLCGTFNSNLQDDFLTPEGDIETAVIPFADKWKTKESCEFLSDSPQVPHPCQLNVENKDRAQKMCAKLKSKVFDDCHWSVDPSTYYEDCLYDMCACKGNVNSCMCPILAAYAAECARQDVIMNWRYTVTECAVKCSPGQVYEECGDACSRTCSDLQEDTVCKATCVEGCRCPFGQALDDNNECIPIASCPCEFNGLKFYPGYKEVRPGIKHLNLCTCNGAKWICKEALDGDSDRYPPASNIRKKCRTTDNEEFTTCEPVDVITCKNMHLIHEMSTPADCRAGCVCKKGYVLDVSQKKCVLPKDCSCHHGGRSYNDGDQIQEDCNTCSCRSGKWDCTKRHCASTCVAWGDSHIESFDGKDFDFQGVCDYVLSKGSMQGGEGFSVTLQNVLCGSQGVTCSKSVTVSINGPHSDSITLSADSPIPGIKRSVEATKAIKSTTKSNKLLVHRAGIFIVVEAPGLGIQVKWDRGTRVYVKLENKWKGRVVGLCGNYNGDAKDDLKTPSGGVETSPAIFGHSWKLQDFCAVPTEPIDACAEHPQRKTWAQRKCGILKSQVFKPCHTEVPVEKYLKRCIFDTCACDQGGDCECLCTALAAYAHACAMRGVPIKWRTPDLCPMQCDPHCSSYSSCVPSCPVETCDNALDQGKAERMCHEDSCVEGCKIKPCSDGFIYLNDTFSECVPKSICKPICLEMDGVVYYEGDVMSSDKCHTCSCTRGKKVCSGQPCSGILGVDGLPGTPPMNQQIIKCAPGWTNWMNQDKFDYEEVKATKTKPKGFKKDDTEPIPSFLEMKNEKGFGYCDDDLIEAIECRTVGTHHSPKFTGQNVECSLERGLVCTGECFDYEIRLLCACEEATTPLPFLPGKFTPAPTIPQLPATQKPLQPLPTACDNTKPHVEYPGDCYKFRHCQPNTKGGWSYVEKTCGPSMMYNPVSMVCDWPSSVIAIKPECGTIEKPKPYTPAPSTLERLQTQRPLPVELYPTVVPTQQLPTACDMTKPHVEYPGDCYKFRHCQPNTKGGWSFVEKTCGPSMMYNPVAMVCDWPSSVIAMKPECGEIFQTQKLDKPLSEIHSQIGDVVCPKGFVWSKCAIPCGQACNYYGQLLKYAHVECKNPSVYCVEGCVDQSKQECPSNTHLWRDEHTCVTITDCTCMSKMGKVVKPGETVREGPCEKCQCINNQYLCAEVDCDDEGEDDDNDEGEEDNDTKGVTARKSRRRKPSSKKANFGGATKPTEPSYLVIPTVTPPPQCNPLDFVPMIDGEYPIPDSSITGTTSASAAFSPENARKSSKPSVSSGGSWQPAENDVNQYLQIVFPKQVPLYGVSTIGSPIFESYVTSFKILYSHDGTTFSNLNNKAQKPQIFRGPNNPKISVIELFEIPIEAKVIRILPLTWVGDISMQVELIGCSHKEPVVVATTLPPQFLYTTRKPTPTSVPIFTTLRPVERPLCDDPMGVENGQISPSQIKVSSTKPTATKTKSGSSDSLKFSTPKGWRPLLDSPSEFIQFDFLEPRNLTGINSKGGPDGWVTGYNVLYSPDNFIWNKVLEQNREPKVFLANFDGISPKVNYFNYPINARYLKIVPVEWHNTIEMKVEPLGCFKPYPISKITVRPTVAEVEEEPSECGTCPGVLVPPMPIPGICKCFAPQFWNGQECVQRSECPCMVGLQPYNVGTRYETEDCSECVCVLGGVAQCKPQTCPPCKTGLRPVKSASCLCLCEPCPELTVMCVSSGACIAEEKWCDGIQDCPDDEVNCQKKGPLIESIVTQNTTITKTCPDPSCPSGFVVKVSEKQTPRKMSTMFQTGSGGGVKTTLKRTYTKPNSNVDLRNDFYQSTLPVPEKMQQEPEEECVQFVCLPVRPPGSMSQTKEIKCPHPVCPQGYDVIIEVSKSTSQSDCAKYRCEPQPQNDGVCNVTGRTFNTFDGTEFKYDICSHVLAREFANDKWQIVLRKNCSAGNFVCTKELEIKDKKSGVLLTVFQDFSLEIDGYVYTVQQLQKSFKYKDMFTVSKIGNTVVYISKVHGFWLSFDKMGDVKIGVSGVNKKTVDGLCGYFNDEVVDDKRLPSGKPSKSTVEFGDSWYIDQISKENCKPHACPSNLQSAAWAMCNAIKNEAFAPCVSAVDVNGFISKCIENACECLKENLGDVTQQTAVEGLPETKKCKCFVLQNFVEECLAANENIHLDTWRSMESCEATCPAPLVHQDCFRRRCEPSCDTLDADDCPFVPGTCFSGCYCPQGMVRKGERCVPISECRDCVCDGFGKSQYVTYDRNDFTFDGNCTYLLSRDMSLTDVHTFQVYTTLGPCEVKVIPTQAPAKKTFIRPQKPASTGSCTQSLHILYGPHIIHIQRSNDKSKLDVFIDGLVVKSLPHKEKWIQLSEIQHGEIKLLLPESQVELLSRFEDMSFSLRVPSLKYGAKMEGLCGDCNKNPDNDFKPNAKTVATLPKSIRSKPIKEFAMSWQADEPKLKLNEEECMSEDEAETECIPLPPERDPCMKLLEEDLFGKCHAIVNPLSYLSACQQDLCKAGPTPQACESLSAYARECMRNGICLNWRTPDLCPFDCPLPLTYSPCGCAETCESHQTKENLIYKATKTKTTKSSPLKTDICSVPKVEGCFCPKGKILRSGKCIDERECNPCDKEGHFPGDKWYPDKCTDCECGKDGKTVCAKKKCSVSEVVCPKGFNPIEVSSKGDCCPKFNCVPIPTEPPKAKCPEPQLPNCGPGQQKKMDMDQFSCPRYICECKPISECDPVKRFDLPLKPGMKIVEDTSGCCPTKSLVCDKSTCPLKPKGCDLEFYELISSPKNTKGDCCEQFECIPPKNKCIVIIDGKKYLKAVGEKWPTTNPCLTKQCTMDPSGKLLEKEMREVCTEVCEPGFELQVPEGKCCGKCIQTQCKINDKTYNIGEVWIENNDNCTKFTCSNNFGTFMVASSTQECPDVSKCDPKYRIRKGCCEHCMPPVLSQIVDNKTNCVATPIVPLDTLNLVTEYKPVHGKCVNQGVISGFTQCQGGCESGSKYNSKSYQQDQYCHCCVPTKTKEILISMTCEDKFIYTKSITVPASCSCNACGEAKSAPMTKTTFTKTKS